MRLIWLLIFRVMNTEGIILFLYFYLELAGRIVGRTHWILTLSLCLDWPNCSSSRPVRLLERPWPSSPMSGRKQKGKGKIDLLDSKSKSWYSVLKIISRHDCAPCGVQLWAICLLCPQYILHVTPSSQRWAKQLFLGAHTPTHTDVQKHTYSWELIDLFTKAGIYCTTKSNSL